jgi:hypothetical protein
MELSQTSVLNFLIAFVIITIVGVYMINLPHIISNQPDLVAEYYKTNWKWNIPLDLVLVAIYFGVANYISTRLGLEKISSRLAVLIAVTIVISGSVKVWFTSRPETSSFFSRWFYRAGWAAVVYDVVLLSSMFLTYSWLNSRA